MRGPLLAALVMLPALVLLAPTAAAECPTGPNLCANASNSCAYYNIPVGDIWVNGVQCVPKVPHFEVCRFDPRSPPPFFHCRSANSE